MGSTRARTPRTIRALLLIALASAVTACGGSQGGSDPDCPAPASATEAAAEPSPCDEGGGFGY